MATPNITVYNSGNANVKIGKFYRPRNEDTYTGFKWTIGSAGQPTALYPVDTSKIKREFKFERTDSK